MPQEDWVKISAHLRSESSSPESGWGMSPVLCFLL
jgi:hypothetical protein